MFPILLGKNNDLEKRVKTLEESGGGGSSGGVLVVTDTDGTLDKTWQEIHDADLAVIKTADGETCPVTSCYLFKSNYVLICIFCDGSGTYSENDYMADSANGYPVKEKESDT